LGDRGDNHCQEEGWAKLALRETREFGGIGFGARFTPQRPVVLEEGELGDRNIVLA